VLFELMDHLAGPRLRNAILIGGAGETPLADDVAEDFERLEMHDAGLMDYWWK
jgi:hypothetical protein